MREQKVYLPSCNRWVDAWHPEKSYAGGQTISIRAELHQAPIFIRAGSKLILGDLNKEYREALAIAEQRPDLKALDAEVKTWFDQRRNR